MSLGQEIPIHPWTKLATDIFHFEGESYLLPVDYTSHFLVICKLNSMTAQHVINHFKLIFLEYGWSDTLVSDNMCLATHQMQANLKPYKPEAKQDQEAKKYHMQTLTKNCEKNTCNNNLAQSRARRQIRHPAKLGQ